MSRKTIYISGPITNEPDYMDHFIQAEIFIYEKMLKNECDYTGIINPARINERFPCDFTHDDYMKICLAELDLCHGVYMLKGWQHSKGANMEHTYAQNLGLEIIYEDISN